MRLSSEQALFDLSGVSIIVQRTGSRGLSGLITVSFGFSRLALGTVASCATRLQKRRD